LVITLSPGWRGVGAWRVFAEFRADGKVAALRPASRFQSYHLAISLMVAYSVIFVTTDRKLHGGRMKTLTANDAKYGFGRLIHLVRACGRRRLGSGVMKASARYR
jgi:hypothetical protein